MKEVIENKICFIMCVNNEQYEAEALNYINKLYIPEGYMIDAISVKEANSMASGYNEAMLVSDAKYKVYLHQDVFLINRNLISDILEIFSHKEIGMIGVVGAEELPWHGIMWHEPRVGELWMSGTDRMKRGKEGEIENEWKEVEAIDGLLMITQYDILWREDLFDGWDFYDVSQSIEMRKNGYKVVVPRQKTTWCIHDSGNLNLKNYYKYREIFQREYLFDKIQENEQVKKLNENKICFIMCVNNEYYESEALSYIRKLYVPEGYMIDAISVKDAVSMASGYNEAMRVSDAKYKVYLHQDVFLINKYLIADILKIFSHQEIGMIGAVGTKVLPWHGIMWYGSQVGELWSSEVTNMELLKKGIQKEWEEVQAIDGFLMITQYDIPWREDLFDGWDFYDASQVMEMQKKGYKVVVPKQKRTWCIHDSGSANLKDYYRYREIFQKEYLLHKNDNGEL